VAELEYYCDKILERRSLRSAVQILRATAIRNASAATGSDLAAEKERKAASRYASTVARGFGRDEEAAPPALVPKGSRQCWSLPNGGSNWFRGGAYGRNRGPSIAPSPSALPSPRFRPPAVVLGAVAWRSSSSRLVPALPRPPLIWPRRRARSRPTERVADDRTVSWDEGRRGRYASGPRTLPTRFRSTTSPLARSRTGHSSIGVGDGRVAIPVAALVTGLVVTGMTLRRAMLARGASFGAAEAGVDSTCAPAYARARARRTGCA